MHYYSITDNSLASCEDQYQSIDHFKDQNVSTISLPVKMVLRHRCPSSCLQSMPVSAVINGEGIHTNSAHTKELNKSGAMQTDTQLRSGICHTLHISGLLLLSSISALFSDSSYIPIISVFQPTFYLALWRSCNTWQESIVSYIVVSLFRAFPASEYMSVGFRPVIAYVIAWILCFPLQFATTVAMAVQCRAWQYDPTGRNHTTDTTIETERTPLRVAVSEQSCTKHNNQQDTPNVINEVAEDQATVTDSDEEYAPLTCKAVTRSIQYRSSLSQFVFPVLLTSIYQIVFRFAPIGGTGNPAMGLTQVNGLRQTASILGEISLVFWIGWLGTVIVGSGALDEDTFISQGLSGVLQAIPHKSPRRNEISNRHTSFFVVITMLMFIFGSIRELSGRGFYVQDISEWPITKANEAPLQVSCLTSAENRQIISRTNERLAAGDDLIIWAEGAVRGMVHPNVFNWNDQNTGQVIAAAHVTKMEGMRNKFHNRVQLFQDGKVVASYDKNRPVPILESFVQGSSITPQSTNVTFTPQHRTCNSNTCNAYGTFPRQDLNLKTAMGICFDFDFSYLFQSAHDADLVIGPSNYFAGIGQNFWEHNIFRAIENGFTLIKCSEYGITGSVDPYGRPIVAFPTLDNEVHTFEVPVQKGVDTVYGNGGWMFGWICLCLSPLFVLLTAI